MSHLGDRLTAWVDDELNAAERARVVSHLALCGDCRQEAGVLRELKGRLRGVDEAPPPDALLSRLSAMSEPGEPLVPAARSLPLAVPAGRGRVAAFAPSLASVGLLDRARLVRARYVVAGAATLAVVGVGAASFAAGAEPAEMQRIAPAVEQYAGEHARRSGDVPIPGPTPQATPGGTP